MQVVLLNGPRGVGKDTAARAMMRPGYSRAAVMDTTKLEVLRGLGISPDLLGVYDTQGVKDVPLPEFGGLSFRQCVINYVNTHDRASIVKRWGEALDAMRYVVDVAVVTDARFFEEFATAVDIVGGKNVLLVRVVRAGHTWAGDIGYYIEADRRIFRHWVYSLVNDASQALFEQEAATISRITLRGMRNRAS